MNYKAKISILSLLTIGALLALVAIAISCSNDVPNKTDSSAQSEAELVTINQFDTLLTRSDLNGNQSQQGGGIHVTGFGAVAASPNIAELYLTVETIQVSVTKAREIVGRASDQLRRALTTVHDVSPSDIETRNFRIQPEYDYRSSKTVLLGYRVTNSMVIKVRDLDSIGGVIDDAAAAAGNSLRVNSIQFTVDDAVELEIEARTIAIENALDKSDQFATATGVTRGDLLYISESYSPSPKFAMATTRAMAEPSTVITPGKLEITVTVQAIFGIR
jgi:uncharacterized protein YggE